MTPIERLAQAFATRALECAKDSPGAEAMALDIQAKALRRAAEIIEEGLRPGDVK